MTERERFEELKAEKKKIRCTIRDMYSNAKQIKEKFSKEEKKDLYNEAAIALSVGAFFEAVKQLDKIDILPIIIAEILIDPYIVLEEYLAFEEEAKNEKV